MSNGNFLERWRDARANFGFADKGVLTTRGVVVMSLCFFITSFCIVSASYKLAIPPNRPTILDVFPLWALIIVGVFAFIAAIGIMSPVDDYIINRDSSYERKEQKKKQKRSSCHNKHGQLICPTGKSGNGKYIISAYFFRLCYAVIIQYFQNILRNIILSLKAIVFTFTVYNVFLRKARSCKQSQGK